MHKGIIKPAYNYNHYLSQRPDKKILKQSMYILLDNPETTIKGMRQKIKDDNKRYKSTCRFLNNVFKD